MLGRNAGAVVGKAQEDPAVVAFQRDLQLRCCRAACDSGIVGVLDQVHQHLQQLAGVAAHKAIRRARPANFKTRRRALFHPMAGALHHGVEFHRRDLLAHHRREALQAAHDVGGALGTFDRAVHQRGQILHDVVDAQLLAQRLELGRQLELVHRFQVAAQTPSVALQHVHVAQHEADGIVEFVRHTRHQSAQRGHLFRMQQLLLRLLECLVRLPQLPVGTLEFAQRSPHQHAAHLAPGAVASGRAVQIDRDHQPVGAAQVDLHHRSLARGRVVHRQMPALHALVVGQQVQHRRALERSLAATHELAQRRIRLFDQAVLTAGDEHVAHRREQAEDELLRLLELRVLFFQLDLVGDELGVDLVHLLDHVQPRGFVHAFEGVDAYVLQR